MDNFKKTKKIKIDIKNKRNQDNIKYIFENIIRNNNTFNLNINKDYNIRNYSPCFIISKEFFDELKQLFNYDYFEKNNELNINLIIRQRNNVNIIYLNNLKEITINDFKNNNIMMLDEISFLSLYNIIPNLEKEKSKYKICEIYLKQNKGIILIKENELKLLFIFEKDGNIDKLNNYELINFEYEPEIFSEIKIQLDKNNINDDIWNKLIFEYCNNCNFIVNQNKNDINLVIKQLSNKINNYKYYFQNNQINSEIDIKEKLKGFSYALNLYENFINEKELYIQQLIKNNNSNKFINNNKIENINLLSTNNTINNNINNYINNNDIINSNIPRIKIDRFKPSIGLGNIGSSCYMNATLQSLAHIPELVEELINNNNYINRKDNKNDLTKHFISLMKNIYFPKTKRGFYSPYDIKNIIGMKENLFRGNEAEDAKDLYIFLIETMNYELNGGINQIYNDIIKLGIDLRDQFKVKQTFLNEFKIKNNNSPFVKYLYGFAQTISECLKCKTKKYNYECFNFINFTLFDIKNYTKKYKANYNEEYILNIDDCFLYNQKFEIYNGNNKMMCYNCNSFEDGSIQRLIDISPPILVIILDRGINNMNFKDNFNFDEYLDLSEYILDKNSFNKYYLSGSINHLGESGQFGHFVTFNKMDINSPWYLYNDSKVSQCKDINDVFNFGKPYILFYHFIDN